MVSRTFARRKCPFQIGRASQQAALAAPAECVSQVHCSLNTDYAALCPSGCRFFRAVIFGEVARDELCNVRRERAARAGRSDTAAVDLLRARLSSYATAAANRLPLSERKRKRQIEKFAMDRVTRGPP